MADEPHAGRVGSSEVYGMQDWAEVHRLFHRERGAEGADRSAAGDVA
jgi:hypothetical protein